MLEHPFEFPLNCEVIDKMKIKQRKKHLLCFGKNVGELLFLFFHPSFLLCSRHKCVCDVSPVWVVRMMNESHSFTYTVYYRPRRENECEKKRVNASNGFKLFRFDEEFWWTRKSDGHKKKNYYFLLLYFEQQQSQLNKTKNISTETYRWYMYLHFHSRNITSSTPKSVCCLVVHMSAYLCKFIQIWIFVRTDLA